jgi:hypothetical protein
MTLIQCKSGAATPIVGGETYDFQRDKHGRFVCEVHKLTHVECLLSIADHYVKAEEIVEAAPVTEEKPAKPAPVTSEQNGVIATPPVVTSEGEAKKPEPVVQNTSAEPKTETTPGTNPVAAKKPKAAKPKTAKKPKAT